MRWRVLALVPGGLVLGAFAAAWRLRFRELPRAELIACHATAEAIFVRLPDGTVVHYRDRGTAAAPGGTTLVLLHGGNASLFTWEPWVEQLRGALRVITVDLPGHGLTAAAPGADYRPAAMVDFVARFTQAIGLDAPYVLGGNSMGGHVAWRFALAHPERLAGLVLVAPGGVADPAGPQGRIVRMVRTPGGAALLARLYSEARLASGLRDVVYDPALITPAMVARAWDLGRGPGTFDAMVARLRAPSFDPAMVARPRRAAATRDAEPGARDTVIAAPASPAPRTRRARSGLRYAAWRSS